MANIDIFREKLRDLERNSERKVWEKECTRKGIPLTIFQFFCGKHRTCLDLYYITDKEWDKVFEKGYWDICKADEIVNQTLAELIVEITWLFGSQGIILMQDVLGVTKDAYVCSETVYELNERCDDALFEMIKDKAKDYAQDLYKKNKKSPFSQQDYEESLRRINSHIYKK